MSNSTQPALTPEQQRSPNPNGGVCVMRMSILLGMRFHFLRHSSPLLRLKAHLQNSGCQLEMNWRLTKVLNIYRLLIKTYGVP